MTLDNAAKLIRTLPPTMQIEILLEGAKRAFAVPREDLIGRSKDGNVVMARYMVWHTYLKNHQALLGRRFLENKFDRSRLAIRHGLKKYTQLQKQSDTISDSERGFAAEVADVAAAYLDSERGRSSKAAVASNPNVAEPAANAG